MHFGNHCRVCGDVIISVRLLQISKVLIISIITICLVKQYVCFFQYTLAVLMLLHPTSAVFLKD